MMLANPLGIRRNAVDYSAQFGKLISDIYRIYIEFI